MKQKEKINMIKAKYLPGMRIRLIKMDDVQAPPIGTEGTVKSVDDVGNVKVQWDTGSCLRLVVDVDEVEIIRK